jgi:hypothetical protein
MRKGAKEAAISVGLSRCRLLACLDPTVTVKPLFSLEFVSNEMCSPDGLAGASRWNW